MKRLSFNLAALSLAALLASCGGSDPLTISGLAASGAPMANASVTAKCVTGAPLSTTTDAGGNFVITFKADQVPPCLVQVSSASMTLHGFASEIGRMNVTTLTDMAIAKALGVDTAASFEKFDSAQAASIKVGLADAKSYVNAQITALTGSAPKVDIFTGIFAIGDADDKLLDKLLSAMGTGSKKIADLRAVALAGLPLKAGLDRGTLIEAPVPVFTLTAAMIDAGPLKALTGPAKCDVKVVALNYNTIGVKGEASNASGVMLVPSGANCTAAAGLVAYAKGTDVQKLRTLANPQDGETFLLAAMYAAQGYAVVATDYLGFAKSTYSYHPYLHADSEASSVIDSIRAARNAAVTTGATLSGKVMLTGYSQGGHASMAAHRAIERDNAAEINVVAGAHLAGPYNMSGSLKSSAVIAGYQFFVPYLVTAWQKVYGNVYVKASDAFKLPYDSYIESLLPSATLDYTTLITSGKLPYGPSPTEARDAMFQSEFIKDTLTNNNSGLYLAGKKNDLLGWNPKSKLLLCGGAGDPTVPPALHQAPMKADFDSRKLSNVTTVDVDAYVQATYGPGGKAPTDPASPAFSSYYGSYHGTYEPPFCHAQAKATFDTVK
jgi:pimeloyl-ACP methyl ester carboxylesterase